MIQKVLPITAFILFALPVFAEDGWILRKDSDGIVVYTRPVKGTEYSQFRAITKVKTTLFSVLAMWADPDTYTDWMFNCKAASLLKKETRQVYITYIVSAVPWPLLNRDNILQADTSQDEVTGKITIILTGKPDFIPKVKNMIRVVQTYGKVELMPLEGGEVEVVFEFFMNPGGLIPAPIINLTIIDFPFFTLKKLRDVVKKPKYQEVDYEFFKNFP